MMLAREEPWFRSVPVLVLGADEALLDLLARDGEPIATDHKFWPRYYVNDHQFRHYEVRRVHDEERRGWEEARRVEDERLRLRDVERRKQASVRAIEQHRLARLNQAERDAIEVKGRRKIKDGWLEMLEHAASLVRGTRHEAVMLPDLERDMATIGGWSVAVPFPGWLDRARFEAAFAARLAECEEAEP